MKNGLNCFGDELLGCRWSQTCAPTCGCMREEVVDATWVLCSKLIACPRQLKPTFLVPSCFLSYPAELTCLAWLTGERTVFVTKIHEEQTRNAFAVWILTQYFSGRKCADQLNRQPLVTTWHFFSRGRHWPSLEMNSSLKKAPGKSDTRRVRFVSADRN